MYQAHKREKQNRKLQKDFYRHQGMTVQAGSEEVITPEDKWISKFSAWELADDASSSVPPPPPPAAEESEESEESEEEYDE